jgi:hypothetical protein
MKTVICVDAKNLPDGAKLVKDKEYEVENEFVNALDQRVYIIKGITNKGRTKLGMEWYGYRADRFRDVETIEMEEKVYDYALN